MRHALVVLLALIAAVCMAIGIVVRQRATTHVPYEHGVSPAMLTALVRNRLWWAGTAAAIGGYIFQALALAHGSLLLVQPLLVSSLLFALPMSARLADRRVATSEWGWALLLTAALAIFVLIAKTRSSDYGTGVTTWMVVTVVVAPIVVGCVLFAARAGGWRRAIPLAVAVGVLFGVIAVLTKIVMHQLTDESVAVLVATPALYLLIALGILATVLQQSAFHAGALQTSVPTMLVLEPVVAVVLGAVVLGEHLAVSRVEAAALGAAVAGMAIAAVALGRGEGAYEEQLEAAVARRSS